jgi:hypothetical protein
MKEDHKSENSSHHCHCSHNHHDGEQHVAPLSQPRPGTTYTPSSRESQSIHSDILGSPASHAMGSPEMEEIRASRSTATQDTVHMRSSFGNEMLSTASRPPLRSRSADVGGRRKVAKTLSTVGNALLGTAPHDWYDDSEFKQGTASNFPEIPGEEHRNPTLNQIREQYNPRRDIDGHVTPAPSHSRAPSFNGSVVSGLGIEARGSFDLPSPEVGTSNAQRSLRRDTLERVQRRDTLEVPGQQHHSPTQSSSAPFGTTTPNVTSQPRDPPPIVKDPDKSQDEEHG